MPDNHPQQQPQSGAPVPRAPQDRAQAEAREVKQQAMEDARAVASSARDLAASEADERLDLVGREARTMARALRAASAEAQQDGSMFEGPLRQMSDLCEDMSERLEGKPPQELLRELEHVGRQHPTAFFGAAVALGFASSRFLRAGLEQAREPQTEEPAASESAQGHAERGRASAYGEAGAFPPGPSGPSLPDETA